MRCANDCFCCDLIYVEKLTKLRHVLALLVVLLRCSMRAERIFLTHFSQRYPKIPNYSSYANATQEQSNTVMDTTSRNTSPTSHHYSDATTAAATTGCANVAAPPAASHCDVDPTTTASTVDAEHVDCHSLATLHASAAAGTVLGSLHTACGSDPVPVLPSIFPAPVISTMFATRCCLIFDLMHIPFTELSWIATLNHLYPYLFTDEEEATKLEGGADEEETLVLQQHHGSGKQQQNGAPSGAADGASKKRGTVTPTASPNQRGHSKKSKANPAAVTAAAPASDANNMQ